MKPVVDSHLNDAKANKTKEYTLLRGKHFGVVNDQEVEYEVGDLVPLTESQYANFKDKFEDPDEARRRADAKDAERKRKQEAIDAKKPAEKQPPAAGQPAGAVK